MGYAFGSMGGPLGSSIGMAAGGILGTVLGGGEIKPRDVAKTALGLAGAIAGTAGKMVGSALGVLAGGGEEDGGGGGGGGATVVGGGRIEGESGEMIRLLARSVSISAPW